MKYIIPAIRFKIFMTILLGLIYPFTITGVSQVLFPKQAGGNFIMRGGQVVGSTLIAQSFEKPQYFWSRPSAVGYNPLPSGGSNLGQASADLKKAVDERAAKLKAAHPDKAGEPPQDLLFASASGLDPHISIEAAQYQMQRVAKSRNLSIEQVNALLNESTAERQLGIFGEPTVNVLTLNIALDKSQGIESAPVLVPVPPVAPAAAAAVPAASPSTQTDTK
ncbi:MAG: potassium-transporting ATPase subunit KdpC [Bdellovibrio sp.]|nr:potassium-transporting ATPase subunit KdpC [Bdellovibrio sp.]